MKTPDALRPLSPAARRLYCWIVVFSRETSRFPSRADLTRLARDRMLGRWPYSPRDLGASRRRRVRRAATLVANKGVGRAIQEMERLKVIRVALSQERQERVVLPLVALPDEYAYADT